MNITGEVNSMQHARHAQSHTRGAWMLCRLPLHAAVLLLAAVLCTLADLAIAQPYLGDLFAPPLSGGPGPATPDALWKVALPATYAARCGDGSLPVFYVRAASLTGGHSNDWVFHLPGGGSGADPDTILQTWMGTGHKDLGGPKHLSSRWANASKPAEGIHRAIATNPFADFNHVYIDKCTQDLFTGTRTAILTTTVDITDAAGTTTVPAGTSYSVEFRGRQMIEDVISYLKAGVTYQASTGACGQEPCPLLVMPDPGFAVEVLWTGSSGGGRAAIHSVDPVAALLPNVRVRLVVDAAFQPGAELMDDYHHPKGAASTSLYDGSYNHLDPESNTFPIDHYAGAAWDTFQTWGASMDASCLTHHAASGDQWQCTDEIHVLMHHVTAPFFVRQDLQDPNATQHGACWQVDWRANRGDCYYDITAFATAVSWQMQDLLLQPAAAEEAASMTAGPAGFAPRCRQHVGLTNNAGFFLHGVIGGGGAEWDFVDALWQWFQSGLHAVLVEPTVSGLTPMSCN